VRQFDGHTQAVWWVDIAADGRRMLSGGMDKTIRLWDVQTGAQLKKLIGHSDLVTSVAFLPDGRRAVSCSVDRTVRLWDLLTGAEKNSITVPERPYRLTVSPDGRRVAIGNRSGVQVWDVDSDHVTIFEAATDRVTLEEGRFSPDGRWLLAGGMDGSVRLWDASSPQERYSIRGIKGKVLEVIWTPDGRSFWGACEDGTVRCWDLDRVIKGGQGS
jgi:WD40 repeat protein